MWKVLKAIAGYSSSYDGDDDFDEAAEDLLLDPIHVAGCLNVKSLEAAVSHEPTMAFTRRAFSFINDDDVFVSSLSISPDERSIKVDHASWTADKWCKHLTQLVTFGILVSVIYTEVRGSAKYFAVPKADSTRHLQWPRNQPPHADTSPRQPPFHS
jgi:hypothetical protein